MRSKKPTEKKPPTMMFYKNSYTIPRTKIANWAFAYDAEKKDNYVFRDKLRYHVSTYNRLGTDDQEFTTETQHMTAQGIAKPPPKVLSLPLVSFTSYKSTDTPLRNKLLKEANLPQLPPAYGITDYTTTQQNSYRNPFHDKAGLKPLTMSSPPWMTNRIFRSEVTPSSSVPPPGDYMFFDTHTPVAPIRRMKLYRYKSFDPATGVQSFPEVEEQLEALNDMHLSEQTVA